MTWPRPQTLRVANGAFGPIDLAMHQYGPDDGVPVVFIHGFPELAFSWRHQLQALGDAGYRAIASDMRGYGASSRPDEVAAYGVAELTDDLVGLLDSLDIDRAVFVGHDWGGFVGWAMPVLHPDRVLGVVGVCTPYMPFAPTTLLRQFFTDDEDLYILWFQEDGVAEAVMDTKAEAIFRGMMRGGISPEQLAERAQVTETGRAKMNPFMTIGEPDAPAPIGTLLVDEDELSVYVDTFTETGFRGGINWYRNIDANLDVIPSVGEADLPVPCLMLTAEWDFALRPDMADPMMEVLSDVERHDIPEAGHWVQQEKPDEVNRHLIDWLDRRFGHGPNHSGNR